VIGKRPPKVGVAKIKPLKSNTLIVYDDEPDEVFNKVGERIKKGELKWIYHKVENNRGHHCYKINKKK